MHHFIWPFMIRVFNILCNKPVIKLVNGYLSSENCSSKLIELRGGPEKAIASHSSTLAWKIPWTEEPGRLQSMRLLGVGHDWSNLAAAERRSRELLMNSQGTICTCDCYLKWGQSWDFLGSPVVKTSFSNAAHMGWGDAGSIPGWGTRTLHAAQCSQNK